MVILGGWVLDETTISNLESIWFKYWELHDGKVGYVKLEEDNETIDVLHLVQVN